MTVKRIGLVAVCVLSTVVVLTTTDQGIGLLERFPDVTRLYTRWIPPSQPELADDSVHSASGLATQGSYEVTGSNEINETEADTFRQL